jgi:hypothetical protein
LPRLSAVRSVSIRWHLTRLSLRLSYCSDPTVQPGWTRNPRFRIASWSAAEKPIISLEQRLLEYDA